MKKIKDIFLTLMGTTEGQYTIKALAFAYLYIYFYYNPEKIGDWIGRLIHACQIHLK